MIGSFTQLVAEDQYQPLIGFISSMLDGLPFDPY